MRRKAVWTLAPIVALWACSESDPTPPLGPPEAVHTEAAADPARVGEPVPGEWIVVFRSTADVSALTQQILQLHGGQLQYVYDVALKGFAAKLPDVAVLALRNNPAVAYIEPNRWGGIVATQNNPTWGLDRIDQRDLPLSGSYTYNRDGTGVNAYVLDTGVRLSHNEFGGRASYIPNGNSGDFVNDGHGNAADCHGHGTHVSGTIAGSTYGVAKDAHVWAGRVVNCAGGGTVAMALAGVNWVTANGQTPGVVNMSLGYGNVQSLRDAVENSIAAGFVYAVAAGNGDFFGNPLNACNESPAGAPNALTVGATNSGDSEAYFSNYGPCVDILAPGVSVLSSWYTSNSATNTISGTSMATPHVAGAVALYLEANPSATPAQVSNAFRSNATANTIDLHNASQNGGTANRFLYVGFIGGGGPPVPKPPAAAYASDCSAGLCTFDDTSADSDGDVVAWAWDFGDGTSSTLPSPSHTYEGSGPFTVELTVTDDDGLDASATKQIDPPGGTTSPPAISFRWTCSGLTCNFRSIGGDPDGQVTSRAWDFGDGGTSTSAKPAHSFAAAGTYVVTLAATDNNGAMHWQSVPVVVGSSNDPPFGSFTHHCSGASCSFEDFSKDGDGTVQSRRWEFGDGGTSTAATPNHTYPAAGVYNVTLTVVDDDGAVHSRTRQLQTTAAGNNAPSANFSSSCTNLSCSFTDSSTDGDGSVVSWTWDFGDSGSSQVQNPSHNYASAGSYTVTLTATDDDGATDTASKQVTVSAPPPGNSAPDASYQHSCAGRACSFDDTSTDSDGSIASVTWDFGDGTGSDGWSPAHTFATTGSHTVTVTVTDDDGAADTQSMTINVTSSSNDPPSSNFRWTCGGQTCDFRALGGSSWSWDFGDGGTSNAAQPSHTFPAAGSYRVVLRSTDNAGASHWQTIEVLIGGPSQPPFASFTTSCTGMTCDFTDFTKDPDGTVVSWFWEFGDGATSTAQHPSHSYGAAGTYQVRLTVIDDSGVTHSRSRRANPL